MSPPTDDDQPDEDPPTLHAFELPPVSPAPSLEAQDAMREAAELLRRGQELEHVQGPVVVRASAALSLSNNFALHLKRALLPA